MSQFFPKSNVLLSSEQLKIAATDVRYFARSKFSKSLVHKEHFNSIWQVAFKLGYLVCQER